LFVLLLLQEEVCHCFHADVDASERYICNCFCADIDASEKYTSDYFYVDIYAGRSLLNITVLSLFIC